MRLATQERPQERADYGPPGAPASEARHAVVATTSTPIRTGLSLDRDVHDMSPEFMADIRVPRLQVPEQAAAASRQERSGSCSLRVPRLQVPEQERSGSLPSQAISSRKNLSRLDWRTESAGAAVFGAMLQSDDAVQVPHAPQTVSHAVATRVPRQPSFSPAVQPEFRATPRRSPLGLEGDGRGLSVSARAAAGEAELWRSAELAAAGECDLMLTPGRPGLENHKNLDHVRSSLLSLQRSLQHHVDTRKRLVPILPP